MRSVLVSVSAVIFAVACGGSQDGADAPTKSEPELTAEARDGKPERLKLTAEECEAGGGSVVGDIGDGAVHRADYRCPNGSPPRGTVVSPEGGPIGVEGAVCCAK